MEFFNALQFIIILIWLGWKIGIFYKQKRRHHLYSNNKGIRFLPDTTRQRRDLFHDVVYDINSIVSWCLLNNYPTNEISKRLEYNWKHVQMYETNFRDQVAYVVDKNRSFYLCGSTPTGNTEDANTMRFVVLHELAHMMSESYGHNDEFLTNFRKILSVAVKLKIYTPVNYSKYPVKYCGTTITQSPCDSTLCNNLQ